jgi:galactose mutarotase-like enzyme
LILAGISEVTIGNAEFVLQVLPEAGGRIYSIRHRRLAREMLWQNAGLRLQRFPAGSGYDDHWLGGWDDVIPNDEPACVNGLDLPDHGELWSATFDVVSHRSESITMRANCPVAGLVVEKRISLEDDRIRVRYTIENQRPVALPYMWKLHAAVRLAPGDRIYIPAKRFQLEPKSLGSLEGAELSGSWPLVRTPDGIVDLSAVPGPEARKLVFAYALDLARGECGLYRPSDRTLCLWSFPMNPFRSCMLFASYGGWRDHYVAVLEPATTWPFRLEEAIAAGTFATLAPYGRIDAEVCLQVLSGVDSPMT